MLNEYDKAALAKIDSRHFSELVKLVTEMDTTLRYGAVIDVEKYATAAFALLDLSKPENVQTVKQALQDQHEQEKYLRKEYEKVNDKLMSWLRWANQSLVHRDEVPKVVETVSVKEVSNVQG